jgi:hypothetical protein
MNSQMEGDIALAEHRAVMAALVRESIRRPTEAEYEAVLSELRGVMASCPTTSTELSA